VLFNAQHKAVNTNLYQFKEYGSRRILTEFSKRNCKSKGQDTLLKDIRETGSTDQRHESGRAKHARIEENVTTVDELVGLLSQEDQTQTHRSTRQISRETGLTQSSIIRIIHRDVGLVFFFSFTKTLVCYYCLLSLHLYISHGSVEAHLRCDGIYNNHIIANCLQSVPVKEFWKSVNNWWRHGQQSGVAFLWPTVYMHITIALCTQKLSYAVYAT